MTKYFYIDHGRPAGSPGGYSSALAEFLRRHQCAELLRVGDSEYERVTDWVGRRGFRMLLDPDRGFTRFHDLVFLVNMAGSKKPVNHPKRSSETSVEALKRYEEMMLVEIFSTADFCVSLVRESHFHGILVMGARIRLSDSPDGDTSSSDDDSLKPPACSPPVRCCQYISWLLLKLHRERCVILLDKSRRLYMRRQSRKWARSLDFSIDQAFHETVRKCVEYHRKDNWIVPVLEGIWVLWNKEDSHQTSREKPRIHSIEIWDEEALVAGEIGVECGGVFTSLTGFHLQDGAGTVQMNCLQRFLTRRGFVMWDLGMALDYKIAHGGTLLERCDFLELFNRLRFSQTDRIHPLSRQLALDWLS